MNFAGQLADAIIAAAEANKAAIEAQITTAEGGIEAALLNAIKNAPKPGGMLGMVFPLISNELEAFVKNYVAQNNADALFMLVDMEARAFAKQLGG